MHTNFWCSVMEETDGVPEANTKDTPPKTENIEMEATTTTTTTVRKKRPLEDKICRVCGDKAVAHNFDVITCESCKAFFRRNAFKRDEVRNTRQTNTQITSLKSSQHVSSLFCNMYFTPVSKSTKITIKCWSTSGTSVYKR